MKAIEQALEGVGCSGERHVQRGETAVHYRRPMTVAEAAGLPRKGK